MAMEAKMSFLKDTEMDLSAFLTANDMSRVLSALADRLQMYDMSITSRPEVGSDDLFNAYISAITVSGLSRKTIKQYSYQIGRLQKQLSVPTRSVTVYHLRGYLAQEKARGLADGTLRTIRDSMSAYFGWLWREGLIPQNPVANLAKIKCAKREKTVITDAELERLKAACTNVRDKAIISFLRSTMCRIGEMVPLNRDDIDMKRMECTVIGKGNKQRTAYMGEVTTMLISEYLSTRTDDSPALFLGCRGERFLDNGVRIMLKRIAKKAGVTNNIHPHKFRRTKITELVHRGMPIELVKELAGHEKIDTTMKYVVLDKSDIQNSYRKYS